MPPIAETLVRILPDARNFARELERQVRAQIRDAKLPAVNVKEVNITRAFKDDLRRQIAAELNNAKLPAVQIKSVQITRAFKDDLIKQVNQAVREVSGKIEPVTVPVQVTRAEQVSREARQAAQQTGGGAPPPRRTGGQAPAQQQTAVVRALEAAERRRVNTARLSANVDDEVARAKRNLTQFIRQEIAAEELLERAQASGNRSLTRRVEFLQRRIQKDKEAAQAVISTAQAEARAAQAVTQVGEASSIRQGAQAVQQLTAAEEQRAQKQAANKAIVDRLNAAEQKRLDTSRLFAATADREARARKELDSLIRQEIAAEGLLREAQEAGNRTTIRRVEALQRRIGLSKTAANEEITAAQAEKQAARDVETANKAATSATDTLAAAEKRLAGVQTASAQATTALARAKKELSELRRVDTDLSKAEGQAGESLDDALKAQIATQRVTVQEGIRAAEQRVDRLEKEAVAQRDATRAAETQARATDRATRLKEQGTTRLAQIDHLAATASSEVAAAEIRLGQLRAANAKFIQAEEAARLANNRTLATEIKALIDDTNAQISNAESRVVNTRSMAAQARAQSQLTRGAFSSAATFGGLRGATLAASKSFIVGTAAVVAFAGALKTFATLEETLNTFRATVGATADEMQQVEEAAVRLGRDITLPAVSATDAAQAMLELARAGLSVRQSIAAARGVLQLATAAGIENAQATELVASALNAFGLQGREATRVADLFANAANAAQGSIVDFAVAQQQASAVAAQTGISLRDSVAFLTLFAKAGLRGSDAGTSLRTALIRLINPTDEAAALIEDLGINIRDAQGNIRPDVFAQFGEATQGLSRDLQDMFAATIFGQDAIRAVLIASRQGAAGLREVQEELSRQGTAAEIAAARTEGLSGRAEQLKNTLSGLGITIGEDVAPAVTVLAEAATDFFESLNSGIQTTERFLAPLRPIAPALEAITQALAKGVLPVAAIVLAYKAFGAAVALARAAILRGRAIGLLLTASNTRIAASENEVAVANVRTTATIADLIAGERAQVATNRVLTGSIADVIAAQNLQAASAGRAAGANIGAVATGGLAPLIGRAGAARAALGLLGGGFTAALTAAVAFGAVMELIGHRESEVEKATNELTEAIQRFIQASNPRNLIGLRKGVEDLAASFRKVDAGPQPGASRIEALQFQLERTKNQITNLNTILDRTRAGGGATEGIEAQLRQLEQQRAALEGTIQSLQPLAQREFKAADVRSVQDFAVAMHDLANANRDVDPVLAHNIDLLADLGKVLGRVPTQKEIRFVFNNKATRTSLEQIMIGLANISPAEAAAIQAAFAKRAQLGLDSFENIMHGQIGVPFEFPVEPKINAQAIDRQLRDALNQLEGIDLPLPPAAIPRPVQNMIEQLEAAGPAGKQRLLQIGLDLMDGLREGLDQGGEDAVKSARENLQNVIQQGEEAVRQSVRTARGNVQSMADELVTQVNQVIDQMDFGVPAAQKQIISLGLGVDLRDAQSALRQARSEGLSGEALQPFIDGVTDAQKALNTFAKSGKADIETLQLALEKLQEQQQRRQLVRGVEGAQRELDQLRGSLAGIAAIAPGGSGQIAQMLSDQQALVQDAKDELKSFDLSNLIKGAERVRDKYKEAKDQGVKKLVDEFLRGKKTAADFEKQLRTQLAPVLEELPKKNLGMQFTRAFRQQIDTLVKQAQAVAGFLGIPGTIGPEIERPAEKAAKAAAERLKAAEQLQRAIRDNAVKTEKNTGDTVTVLKFIAKQFAGRPLTKREIATLSRGDKQAASLLKDLSGG